MKYAAYYRVSSDKQKERATIKTQMDAIAQHCKAQKIKLAGQYIDDGISSRVPIEERPDGARLLADAKARRFDGLLVFKLDRLARRAQNQLNTIDKLESLGLKIVAVTQPLMSDATGSVGALLRTMLAGVSQFETDTFRERSMAGHYSGARRNRWQGGKPPFGYHVGKDHTLEIAEDQAKIVREIFRAYISGKSAQKIAEDLNARKVPHPLTWTTSAKARPWYPATVSNILRNPAYAGRAAWRKTKAVEAQGRPIGRVVTPESERVYFDVPALVSPEVWAATKMQRQNNRRFSPRNMRRDYLLRSLIKCGTCGRNYIGTKATNKLGKAYYYYSCTSQTGGVSTKSCGNKAVPALQLEDYIWQRVLQYKQNPDELRAEIDQAFLEDRENIVSLSDQIKEIDKRVEECEEGRQRVISLTRRGSIREDEAVKALDEIQTEREELELRRAGIDNARFEVESFENSLSESLELLESLDGNTSDSEKSAVIRALFSAIVITTVETGGRKHPHAAVTRRISSRPFASSVPDWNRFGDSRSQQPGTLFSVNFPANPHAGNGKRKEIAFNGEVCSIAEWSRRTGINYYTLRRRAEKGQPLFSESSRSR